MTYDIAQRLIEQRKLHGYSQDDLAYKLGVSRQAISKWERAEASPDTDNLIALAKIYDISLDELLSTKPSGQKINDTNDSSEETFTSSNEDINGGIHINGSDGSSVHIGKGGLHLKNGEDGDEVNIDWDGIKVFKNNDSIHTDPKVNITYNDHDYQVHKHNDHNEKKPSLYDTITDSVSFLIGSIAFIILGVKFGMWHPGWLVFLCCPILSAIVNPKKWEGVFPILITTIYLCLGFFFSAWHPGWVVFLTIPVFYTIWNIVKSIVKNKKQNG